MLAAGLALERGWAINLGGGMHHASSDAGMGWWVAGRQAWVGRVQASTVLRHGSVSPGQGARARIEACEPG